MNARQRKAFEKISNDLESWKQLEALGWGESFDYRAISKKLPRDPIFKERLEDLAGRAMRLLMELAPAGFCSDDQLSDICSHIVGLGRSEYLRAIADPKNVIPEHADSAEESFLYCFVDLEKDYRGS